MFTERIEFVQRKFGSLFSLDDEVIFFNPETPSNCLPFFEQFVGISNIFPVVAQLEMAGIKCIQSIPKKFNLAIPNSKI